MFAVLLPALNFRGNRSPYLWWFHKLLSELGDQAGFICGDEYYQEPAQLLAAGRQEASTELADFYRYQLPTRAILTNLPHTDIPVQVWQTIEARYPANPLAAFRHYCLEEDPELSMAIANALDQLSASIGPLEAVITCVNCTTLAQLCRSRNLPLLHIELGPLRQPAFLQTAYFDFAGVNGNTEARERYVASEYTTHADSDKCTQEQLRRLFLMERLPEHDPPDINVGLCLQVEDDSNILCYAQGHSSLSLINDARRSLADKAIAAPVLVRAHPGSYFSIRHLPPGLIPDNSPSSQAFATRCRCIHTINSGLAVESLLLGRNAIVRGDSPFSFCADPVTGRGNPMALAFFLLNYLVPWQLAFTPEYIRWRLSKPDEQDIRKVNQEGFMQEKIMLLERQVVELERQLAAIRSSFAWRLTYPLRVLIRFISRQASR